MKHYHGTPFGGQREQAARFLRGGHALVPFLRPEDLWVVAENCQSFCIDCSAYTAWKTGEPITDWHPYYNFVDGVRFHPGFDFALIPDVIDGTELENDRLISEWPFGVHIGVPDAPQRVDLSGWKPDELHKVQMRKGTICYAMRLTIGDVIRTDLKSPPDFWPPGSVGHLTLRFDSQRAVEPGQHLVDAGRWYKVETESECE